MSAGLPSVAAAVSDGRLTLSARFALGTGVDRAIRLSDVLADAPGANPVIATLPSAMVLNTVL